MQEPAFSTGKFATIHLQTPTSAPQRVTAVATSAKFVLLGHADGTLSLLDVFGNPLDSQPQLHPSAISAVALGGGQALDEIAVTASTDGTIRAARLFTGPSSASNSAMLSSSTLVISKQSTSGVVAVAVDPSFGKPRFGDRIAWADRAGKVFLFTAGWFGGSESVLEDGSLGPVSAIAWSEFLLAVATEGAVRIFDTRFNRAVCVVAPPATTSPARPALENQSSPPEPSSTRPATPPVEPDPENTHDLELENSGDNVRDVSAKSGLHSPIQWVKKTKVFMEIDESGEVSPHGESTVLAYITWPSGGRIVQIGPHTAAAPGGDKPVRNIDIKFRLERSALPTADLPIQATQFDQDVADFPSNVNDESPLLSLVPFGEDIVALLGTPAHGIMVHLVSPKTGDSIKHMQMKYEKLTDGDLVTIPGGDPLVLVVGHTSPQSIAASEQSDGNLPNQDVTYVRSLNIAEKVQWLLGQNRFSDALQIAQCAPGGSLRRAEVSIEDVGEQFLDSLVESGNYARLAMVLPETITSTSPSVGFRSREKVMQKRKKRWERWIENFRKLDKLAVLAPVIPTYEPRLAEDMYNGILVELAASDPVVMLDVLKTWPADVFGVSAVTKAIEGHLSNSDSKSRDAAENREPLREGLLMMYGLSGRHDETLNLLLREQSPKVYDYIRSHHLYEAVRSPETITGLYKIDPTAATDILSHAPDTVLPPETVVPILGEVDNTQWTFMYLHAMFRMDVDYAPKYHNQLLRLYVNHGTVSMLNNFLKTSTHYSLDRALQEMGGPKGFKTGHLAKERVFVLSTMGDLNSAMDILLDELGDTFAAIEFASDHGDTDLWERLIEHAKTNAETLAALLDSPAGGKVDPVRLVPLLGSEMKIPHLRDRLHRILVDAALERALREDAAAALHHDANELLSKLDESVSVLES